MAWGAASHRKGGHRKGHKVSAATRAKLSKRSKGKKHPHKGSHTKRTTHGKRKPSKTKRHVSAATRAKLSKRLKGKKHPHRGSHAKRHSSRARIHKPRRVAKRHISAAASAKRRGKKHPHAGKGKARALVRHPRVKHAARRPSTTRRRVGKVVHRTGRKTTGHARRAGRSVVGTHHHGRVMLRSRFAGHRHHALRSRMTRKRGAFRSRFTHRRKGI